MAGPADANAFDVPEIMPFQFDPGGNGSLVKSVNLFRGDVNFYFTLASLPGRNGLDVKVAALYRSNVAVAANEWNRDAPTSILGLGWQLPFDRIVADHNGSGAETSRRLFFAHGESWNPLHRTTRRWQRATLDAGEAARLDTGVMSPELAGAFRAQGLIVALTATVQVVTTGARWRISDAVHERTLDIERAITRLDVFDGGQAYELEGFDFSRVHYYAEFERWEVTRGDGITSVFGGGVTVDADGSRTSTGDSIEWGVRWGSFLGPSALTHSPTDPTMRVQSQYPVSWNFAGAHTVWGDETHFTYEQVRQRVGTDGLPYTKACYLSTIVDVFGRTARFHYEDKRFDPTGDREYLDPHKPIPNDQPDAYQSRYETKYLKAIELANEDGLPLNTVTFGYDLRHYARLGPHDPPSMYGDTVKRVLTSITRTLANGTSLPNVQLEYYGQADTHPGAIASVTYPEGGTVHYRYQRKELPSCTRKRTIDSPFAEGTPRVWFGSDYALTAWYDGQGKLQVRLYTWVGRWQRWVPPQSTINAFVHLDDMTVVAQDDFVVLHYATAGGQTTECWVFHKDNLVLGGWTAYPGNPIVLQTTKRDIVGGTGFFAIHDRLERTVTRYTWAPLTHEWTRSPLTGACDPNTSHTRFFITAYGNVLLSLCYDIEGRPDRKKNRLRLDYLDDLGAWQTGDTVSAPEITIVGTDETVAERFTWSPASWVMAATFMTTDEQASFTYRLALYQWHANGPNAYKFLPVTLRDYTQKTTPEFVPPYSYAAEVNTTGLVLSGAHLLRYNGAAWLDNDHLQPQLSFDPDNVFWFSLGEDCVIKTENSPDRVIGAVQAYDANTQVHAWSAPAITLFDSQPTLPRLSHYFPSAGLDLLSWNIDVYARGTSNSWIEPLHQPIYRLSPSVDTSTIVNESPGFVAHLLEDESGKHVTGTELIVLRNDQVYSTEPLPERFFRVVKEDGHYETSVDGKMPGGPAAFFTYRPLDKDLDQARAITLYRVVADSLVQPIVDYPAHSVEMDDGLEKTEAVFRFDERSAAVDASGHVVKYFRTSLTTGAGEAHGQVEHEYINSLGNLAPDTNPSLPAALDGQLARRVTRDASGAIVAVSASEWEVKTRVALSPQDASTVPLFGAYIQIARSIEQNDGVERTTVFTYDPATGRQTRQQSDNYNASGQLETIRMAIRYAYQVYPAVWYANDFTDTVQSKKSIATSSGEIVTEVKAVTWQPASRTLPDDTTVPVWSTHKTYTWLGGAGSSDFDFAAWSEGQEPPADWHKVSQIVLRDAHGNITEKQSPMGVSTSTLFDRLGGMQVAAFSRASLARGETFYYGFERYEHTPAAWPIDPGATPIVDGIANTGRRCLKIPAGATGATITLHVSAAALRYLFSYWGYSGSAYDPANPAGWTLRVGDDAPLDLPMTGAADWQYAARVLDVPASAAPIAVRCTPYNRGAVDVYLDDVAFAAYQGQLSVSVYEGASLRMAAELGPYDALLRRIYDPWERQISRTNNTQSITRVAVPYLARQDAAAVSSSIFNSELHTQPMGTTFYDRFYNLGDWRQHWSSATPTQWTSADGRLVHASGAAGEITLASPSITQDYAATVFVAPQGAITQAIGLRLGADVTISWDPSTRTWTLTDARHNVSLAAPFTSAGPGRAWFVALTTHAVLFTADGRLVFSYLPASALSGALTIFTSDHVAFNDVTIGGRPQIGIQFSDGAAKLRQGHSIEGANYVVTTSLYDSLARAAVITKGASLAADAAHPLLVYRSSFVEAFDWNTGVMTGDLARAWPEDQGYPYQRQRFEASPIGRVIEAGLPGKDFAIVDIHTTTPSQRHTTKYAYGANQAGGFPVDLNLPAGQYALQTTTDPDGTVSVAVMDKTGTTVASGSLVDPGTSRYITTSYTTAYTPTTRVESMQLPNYYQPPDPSSRSSWQRVTTYDFLGRALSRSEPDGGATTYVYDAYGSIRFSRDPACVEAGLVLYRTYDVSQRPLVEGWIATPWDPAFLQNKANTDPGWPTEADGAVPQRTYTYDGDGTDVTQMGMLTRADIAGGASPAQGAVRLTYEYDTSTYLRTQTMTVPAISADPTVTRYDYDNLGNVTSTVYPSGYEVTRHYDPVGRVRDLTDAGGRVLASYAYNAGDQIVAETLKAGASDVVTKYGYNSPGWISKIDSPFHTETIEYTSGGYQGAGSYSGKISSATTRVTIPAPDPFPADMRYRLAYDRLGRLTTAECTAGGTVQPQWSIGLTTPVTYDANSNFLIVDTGSATERYRYAPGTDQVLNTSGDATASYRYDKAGAIVEAQPRSITNIAYNLLSRLPTTIATASSGTLGFDYDHRGRRAVKRFSDGSRLYVRNPSGWALSEQDFTSSGVANALVEYIYGPSGLIALKRGNNLELVLRDHLKSIRAVLSAESTVAAAFQYEPFGSVIVPSYGDRGALRYYYTGYEIDGETGLYNAVARLYDPGLRRFYGVDPQLQFTSPYIYGGNNPLVVIDPTGQAATWWMILVGAIVGAIATLLTGVAGVALFGAGLAAATAVGAVAGAVGALVGDVTTAALAAEPITAQRMLTDIVTGGVGGAVGALVGGALGQAAAQAAMNAGYAARTVTAITSAVAMGTGGFTGSVAAAGVASAMTGQPFFSASNALSIGLGTLAAMGGALMATGAHFGIVGEAMPVELGPNDLHLIVDNISAAKAAGGADPTYLAAATTLENMGGNEVFLGFVPRSQFLSQGQLMLNRGIDPFFLNGQNGLRTDVVAVHGMGRYVFPLTTSGYMRPIRAELFAQHIAGMLPARAGGAPPLKMYTCFGALTKPWGTGKPGFSFGSSGQILSTALNRTTYGGRWAVKPASVVQNWIRFDP